MIAAKDIITKEYLSVDVQTTVAELIGHMKKEDVTFALVFDGKKYLGLVDKRWLLTSRLDSHQMKIHNILKKRSKSKTPFFVPKLSLTTNLKEICRLMAASNTRALPVLEKDRIEGVVTASAVLSQLKGEYKGIKAKQLASMKLVTAQEKEELGKVIQKMHDNGIDRMPVVDGMNKLTGIATLNDIAKYYLRYPVKSQRVSARGIHHTTRQDSDSGEKQNMLKTPISNYTKPARVCFTAGPETPLHDIMQMMIDDNVCSIILEEKEVPVGIITVKDIIQDYAK
jgi:CBS domain-containing protein